MSEVCTLDANILVYAFDPFDRSKQAMARRIVAQAHRERWNLTLQVIGEFFHVSTRKRILSRSDAAAAAEELLADLNIVGVTRDAVRTGLAEAVAGRRSYWDAVMLATAAEAGCTVCFSEDMGDGARLGAITVINPFGPDGSLSPRAAKLLSPEP